MADHEKIYAVCENKCFVEIPLIRHGTELPDDSDGREGDLFFLFDPDEAAQDNE